MNNQNIAAQATKQEAVLTDGDIRAITETFGGGLLGPIQFARAVETALLSKLRAPVVDEPYAVRAIQAVGPVTRHRMGVALTEYLDEHADAGVLRFDHCDSDNIDDLLNVVLSELRNASHTPPASAPVAQDAAEVHSLTGETGYTGVAPGAPVAGEANSTSWQDALRISELPEVDEVLSNFANDSTGDNAVGLVQAILNAAPQASEAVPDGGIAVMGDVKLPTLPPITHTFASLISPSFAEALQNWARTYTRTAILADRQQRGGDTDPIPLSRKVMITPADANLRHIGYVFGKPIFSRVNESGVASSSQPEQS